MNINKVRCFTDVIHGTIQYSGLESEIISTPLFNRLHRILQSSLVYLTFPSNKTKRFEHSIGVMHLAGEIFHYSILNAKQECVSDFFGEIKTKINEWYDGIDYNLLSKLENRNLLKDDDKSCGNTVCNFEIPDNKLYKKNIPANIGDNKYLFLIVWQAIRIVGLLHDIGHLPYSHILEKSLKELYNNVSSISKKDLNKNQCDFVNIFNRYFDSSNNIELHEQIGNKIFNIIESSIYDTIEENIEFGESSDPSFTEISGQTICLLSFYFAKKILNSKPVDNTIFSDLHTIVASNYDADRMDYCSRDYFATGVRKDILNYERIINSFTLGKSRRALDDPSNPRERFVFAPLAKMSSDIEDILLRRFGIFKDINYHHNVHKTELLMIKCINYLGEKYLNENKVLDKKNSSNNGNHNNKNSIYILPIEIHGLWDCLLKIIEIRDNRQVQYYLIQMDDSWLDTTLKHAFMLNFDNPFKMNLNYNNKEWHQLNELISAKKSYTSIIKRADDFIDFDKNFFEKFKKKLKIKEINTLYEDIKKSALDDDEKIKTLLELMMLLASIENGEYSELFIEQHTFIINKLNNIIVNVMGDKEFFERIKSSIESHIINNCDVLDCMIGEIKFSSGLSEETPLYVCKYKKDKNGNVEHVFEHLNKVSNIKLQLDTKYMGIPLFHVYACPKLDEKAKRIIAIDKSDIIEKLADILSDKISERMLEYFKNLKKIYYK